MALALAKFEFSIKQSDDNSQRQHSSKLSPPPPPPPLVWFQLLGSVLQKSHLALLQTSTVQAENLPILTGIIPSQLLGLEMCVCTGVRRHPVPFVHSK
jgi:hypothetical protein